MSLAFPGEWPGTPGPRRWGLFDSGNPGSYPGRVVKVRPGDLDVEIFDARATDDAGACQVSITMSFTPSGHKANALRLPFARIDFGVSGGRDTVFVDWIHGQVLSMTTTYVRVAATFPTNTQNANPQGFPDEKLPSTPWGPALVGNEQEELLLGASLGSGPHSVQPFGASPRLTTFHTIIANSTSDFVPIPPHAQSVTVLSPVGCSIAAYTRQAPAAALYASAIAAPNLDQFAFPIARGVEFVQLSGAGPNNVLALLFWTIGL